jgi:hypothetical protein
MVRMRAYPHGSNGREQESQDSPPAARSASALAGSKTMITGPPTQNPPSMPGPHPRLWTQGASRSCALAAARSSR